MRFQSETSCGRIRRYLETRMNQNTSSSNPFQNIKGSMFISWNLKIKNAPHSNLQKATLNSWDFENFECFWYFLWTPSNWLYVPSYQTGISSFHSCFAARINNTHNTRSFRWKYACMHVWLCRHPSVLSKRCMVLQYLPRQHACKVITFETTLAHASELTNLNLFCYFIFLSHTRKPVFVALPKGLCCSLCCVSRDTHRSLNGDYFWHV